EYFRRLAARFQRTRISLSSKPTMEATARFSRNPMATMGTGRSNRSCASWEACGRSLVVGGWSFAANLKPQRTRRAAAEIGEKRRQTIMLISELFLQAIL